MTQNQTIQTPQDYVNYTFNIEARGVAEVSSELLGLSNTIGNILGQIAFKTSEFLSHTEMIAIGSGLAIGTMFAQATKDAIHFQQQIANVQAIGGEAINAKDIGNAAMEYSNKFGMATSSMTEGLEALARAGITSTNVMKEVLAEGVKLSKLEGLDLEDSINDLISTTNLLSQSGVDMNDANYGRLVQEMNQHIVSTSESAPINAENIIHTLQHVGGYASASGIDQDDLFAVIAQLGSRGTKGEMAGTALRAFIAAGQKDTAQRALARIGLNVKDLWDDNGNVMLPISEMKNVLDEALEKRGYSRQEKLEFYSDFAGYKQANQIMKIDTAEVQKYRESIANAWDLGKKLDVILGTVRGNLDRIWQISQNFMTKVGSQLLDIAGVFLTPIRMLLEVFTKMPFADTAVAAGMIFVAFKTGLTIFTKLVPSIVNFTTGISGSLRESLKLRNIWSATKDEIEDVKNIIGYIKSNNKKGLIEWQYEHNQFSPELQGLADESVAGQMYMNSSKYEQTGITWEQLPKPVRNMIIIEYKMDENWQNNYKHFIKQTRDFVKDSTDRTIKIEDESGNEDLKALNKYVADIFNLLYKRETENEDRGIPDDNRVRNARAREVSGIYNRIPEGYRLGNFEFEYRGEDGVEKLRKDIHSTYDALQSKIKSFSNTDVNKMSDQQRHSYEKILFREAMTPQAREKSERANESEVRLALEKGHFEKPKEWYQGIRDDQIRKMAELANVDITNVFNSTTRDNDNRAEAIKKIYEEGNLSASDIDRIAAATKSIWQTEVTQNPNLTADPAKILSDNQELAKKIAQALNINFGNNAAQAVHDFFKIEANRTEENKDTAVRILFGGLKNNGELFSIQEQREIEYITESLIRMQNTLEFFKDSPMHTGFQNEINDMLKTMQDNTELFKNGGESLGDNIVTGFIRKGLGRHSPGYMAQAVKSEMEDIDFILNSGLNQLSKKDISVFGETFKKAFDFHEARRNAQQTEKELRGATRNISDELWDFHIQAYALYKDGHSGNIRDVFDNSFEAEAYDNTIGTTFDDFDSLSPLIRDKRIEMKEVTAAYGMMEAFKKAPRIPRDSILYRVSDYSVGDNGVGVFNGPVSTSFQRQVIDRSWLRRAYEDPHNITMLTPAGIPALTDALYYGDSKYFKNDAFDENEATLGPRQAFIELDKNKKDVTVMLLSPESVKTFSNDFDNALEQVSNIIDNKTPLLENKAQTLGEKITDAYIKDGLGIRSPSYMERATQNAFDGVNRIFNSGIYSLKRSSDVIQDILSDFNPEDYHFEGRAEFLQNTMDDIYDFQEDTLNMSDYQKALLANYSVWSGYDTTAYERYGKNFILDSDHIFFPFSYGIEDSVFGEDLYDDFNEYYVEEFKEEMRKGWDVYAEGWDVFTDMHYDVFSDLIDFTEEKYIDYIKSTSDNIHKLIEETMGMKGYHYTYRFGRLSPNTEGLGEFQGSTSTAFIRDSIEPHEHSANSIKTTIFNPSGTKGLYLHPDFYETLDYTKANQFDKAYEILDHYHEFLTANGQPWIMYPRLKEINESSLHVRANEREILALTPTQVATISSVISDELEDTGGNITNKSILLKDPKTVILQNASFDGDDNDDVFYAQKKKKSSSIDENALKEGSELLSKSKYSKIFRKAILSDLDMETLAPFNKPGFYRNIQGYKELVKIMPSTIDLLGQLSDDDIPYNIYPGKLIQEQMRHQYDNDILTQKQKQAFTDFVFPFGTDLAMMQRLGEDFEWGVYSGNYKHFDAGYTGKSVNLHPRDRKDRDFTNPEKYIGFLNKTIKTLDDAILHTHGLIKPTILSRGGVAPKTKHKIGEFGSFTSTSFSAAVGKSFADANNKHFMQILAPAGTKGLIPFPAALTKDSQLFLDELELTLGSFQKYMEISRKKIHGRKGILMRLINAEEIADFGANLEKYEAIASGEDITTFNAISTALTSEEFDKYGLISKQAFENLGKISKYNSMANPSIEFSQNRLRDFLLNGAVAINDSNSVLAFGMSNADSMVINIPDIIEEAMNENKSYGELLLDTYIHELSHITLQHHARTQSLFGDSKYNINNFTTDKSIGGYDTNLQAEYEAMLTSLLVQSGLGLNDGLFSNEMFEIRDELVKRGIDVSFSEELAINMAEQMMKNMDAILEDISGLESLNGMKIHTSGLGTWKEVKTKIIDNLSQGTLISKISHLPTSDEILQFPFFEDFDFEPNNYIDGMSWIGRYPVEDLPKYGALSAATRLEKLLRTQDAQGNYAGIRLASPDEMTAYADTNGERIRLNLSQILLEFLGNDEEISEWANDMSELLTSFLWHEIMHMANNQPRRANIDSYYDGYDVKPLTHDIEYRDWGVGSVLGYSKHFPLEIESHAGQSVLLSLFGFNLGSLPKKRVQKFSEVFAKYLEDEDIDNRLVKELIEQMVIHPMDILGRLNDIVHSKELDEIYGFNDLEDFRAEWDRFCLYMSEIQVQWWENWRKPLSLGILNSSGNDFLSISQATDIDGIEIAPQVAYQLLQSEINKHPYIGTHDYNYTPTFDKEAKKRLFIREGITTGNFAPLIDYVGEDEFNRLTNIIVEDVKSKAKNGLNGGLFNNLNTDDFYSLLHSIRMDESDTGHRYLQNYLFDRMSKYLNIEEDPYSDIQNNLFAIKVLSKAAMVDTEIQDENGIFYAKKDTAGTIKKRLLKLEEEIKSLEIFKAYIIKRNDILVELSREFQAQKQGFDTPWDPDGSYKFLYNSLILAWAHNYLNELEKNSRFDVDNLYDENGKYIIDPKKIRERQGNGGGWRPGVGHVFKAQKGKKEKDIDALREEYRERRRVRRNLRKKYEEQQASHRKQIEETNALREEYRERRRVRRNLRKKYEERQASYREQIENAQAGQYQHIMGNNVTGSKEEDKEVNERIFKEAQSRYSRNVYSEMNDFDKLRYAMKGQRGEKFFLKGIDLYEKGNDFTEKIASQIKDKLDNYNENMTKNPDMYKEGYDFLNKQQTKLKDFSIVLGDLSGIFPILTPAVLALNTALSMTMGITDTLSVLSLYRSATLGEEAAAEKLNMLATEDNSAAKIFNTILGWENSKSLVAQTIATASKTAAEWINVKVTMLKAAIEDGTLIPKLIGIIAIVGVIIGTIKLLQFWENKHAKALQESQAALKEATVKNNTALSQYKDLKKARENETDAMKKQQAARKEAIALYELEVARIERRKAIHDEAKLRNNAVWGEYGFRASLQKMGWLESVFAMGIPFLGTIGKWRAGEFESQYENYEGTTANIRKVKEDTIGNWNTTAEQRYVASIYDANKYFFAEIEAYKEPLQALYDKESQLIEQYGSIDLARGSKEFKEAVQEFSDATGLNGETAVKMLEWLETENKVDQATKVAEAQIKMVRARADAKAMGIDLDSSGFGENMDDVGKAMVYAQIDQMIKDEKHEMWWTMLWEYLQAIISALLPWKWGDVNKHLSKANAYQEGIKELEGNRQEYYDTAMEYYANADRRNYDNNSIVYGDAPFGWATEGNTQHFWNKKTKEDFIFKNHAEKEKQHQNIKQSNIYSRQNAENISKMRKRDNIVPIQKEILYYQRKNSQFLEEGLKQDKEQNSYKTAARAVGAAAGQSLYYLSKRPIGAKGAVKTPTRVLAHMLAPDDVDMPGASIWNKIFKKGKDGKRIASKSGKGLKTGGDVIEMEAKGGKYVAKGGQRIAKEGGEAGAETLAKTVGKTLGKAAPLIGPAVTAAFSIAEHNPFEKHYNEDGSEKRALQSTGEVVGEIGGSLLAAGLGVAATAVGGPIAGAVVEFGASLILEPLGKAIGGVLGWLGDELINGLAGSVSAVWDGLTSAAGSIWDTVSGTATGIWDWISGGVTSTINGTIDWLTGDSKNSKNAYTNITSDSIQQKTSSPNHNNNTTIVIKNININTEDDPEKIKTAFMNLMIELEEQITPRQVSRVTGEAPSTSSDLTTDTNTANPDESTDPNNPNASTDPNATNSNNTNNNPTL